MPPTSDSVLSAGLNIGQAGATWSTTSTAPTRTVRIRNHRWMVTTQPG